MTLNETIIAKRKAKNLTQQELADITHTDLRTIQRIESGKSKPRAFNIRAIEQALGFEAQKKEEEPTDAGHLLHLLCLSCFSYLLIPYVHFLIPQYLLNHNKVMNSEVRGFAKKVICQQIYWVVATMLVFLIVLLINLVNGNYVNYFIPFFVMYGLNSLLIGRNIYQARSFAVQMP